MLENEAGGGLEERQELRGQHIRSLLGDVVAGGDGPTAQVVRPRPVGPTTAKRSCPSDCMSAMQSFAIARFE